jgi:hypothetical protein
MGARATRTARCASEKKRPKRSKEHFERSHAITPSAQPSRRPFRSAFSRNLTTPHTTGTKISRKRARRKKRLSNASTRTLATTRRAGFERRPKRCESRNRTRGTRRTYHCDFYRTRVWICLTKSGGKSLCSSSSSFFINLGLHLPSALSQTHTNASSLKDNKFFSRVNDICFSRAGHAPVSQRSTSFHLSEKVIFFPFAQINRAREGECKEKKKKKKRIESIQLSFSRACDGSLLD